MRALFPGLLGEGFASLHPFVRAVHGGQSGRWNGRASVRRGSHLLARIAATIARLPVTQLDVPVVVTIETQDGREVWTRHFGSAVPMQSTLCNSSGWLVERMGPLALQFQVNVQDGGMSWYLRRIAFLGLPLPRRLFQVQARADAGRGYRFFVSVGLAGVGDLIRYEGELDVTG
ncbi:MAG: DUF4166 domain-containing protein [Pseudomonadota bacterium]